MFLLISISVSAGVLGSKLEIKICLNKVRVNCFLNRIDNLFAVQSENDLGLKGCPDLFWNRNSRGLSIKDTESNL